MNNILVRTLSGAVYIGVILLGLAINPLTALLVMGLFDLLALWEFATLLNHSKLGAQPLVLTGSGIMVFLALAFVGSDYRVALVIPLLAVIVCVIELFRKVNRPIENASSIVFSWFYIVFPLFVMCYLGGNDSDFHPIIPIGMLLIVWTNDTFAFLTGKFLGKTPLFPRVSPKKTIEGSVGGLAFALLCSILIAYFAQMELKYWILATAVIVPSAALGDLVESAFKRSLNVKDSGNLIPGHGGILDRMDASLLAAPVFFVFHLLYFSF